MDDEGLRRYMQAIQRFPRLDREDEQRLARRWKRTGDRAAADALVSANLRYVVKIASQYRGYGLRLADLVEEGNVGLLEATHRFDARRKVRFMTYAGYWIRAYILAYVLKHSSIVGMGTGPVQSKLFFGLHRERAKLSSQLGEETDTIDRSLATTFKTSEDRIRLMTGRLGGRDSSLDAPAFRDGEVSAIELLCDDVPDQEERLGDAERDAEVRRRLAVLWDDLDSREQIIVQERLLGDGGEDGPTLADLGRRMGLSRERVRQLEERVKSKLRRALEPVTTPIYRAA